MRKKTWESKSYASVLEDKTMKRSMILNFSYGLETLFLVIINNRWSQ